jgi:hypothetical protein
VANNPKLSNAGANAAANAACALCNSGKLRIYDSTGTGQPSTADTAVTTQVLLAELTFGATAFDNAVAGVAAAKAITADSVADHTGTATWFRAVGSGGADPTDVVFDGSVGTANCDLNLNTVSIVANAAVSVTSLTYTQSKA